MRRHSLHMMHRHRQRLREIIARAGREDRQRHPRAAARFAVEEAAHGMTDGAVAAHHGEGEGPVGTGLCRNACLIAARARFVPFHAQPRFLQRLGGRARDTSRAPAASRRIH